jgi:hypothetical protein
MFKKTGIVIFLLFLGMSPELRSQHLSHQVLVPAAGVKSAGSINYSQTAGETAVEIFNAYESILTQGFQQPRIILLPVIQPSGNGVDVYPNPATDNLTIKLFGDRSRDFRIEIITITGMTVIAEEISFTGTYNHEELIPVRDFKNGLYFVRITTKDKTLNRTFKIEKL